MTDKTTQAAGCLSRLIAELESGLLFTMMCGGLNYVSNKQIIARKARYS